MQRLGGALVEAGAETEEVVEAAKREIQAAERAQLMYSPSFMTRGPEESSRCDTIPRND